MSKSKSVPGYKLHKATGQARTIVNGRHVYLGKYGTAEIRPVAGRERREPNGASGPPCPAP